MQPAAQTFTGRYKRPGIPRINWRHPLAQGLLFYGYDTGGGVILDLVGARWQTKVPGTTLPAPLPSQHGSGFKWNNSAGLFFASDPTIRNATANPPFSFACAYVQTGVAVTNSVIFGRTANNFGSAPFVNWALQVNFNAAGQTAANASVDNGGVDAESPNWTGNANNVFTSLLGVAKPTSISLFAQGGLVGTTGGLTVASSNTNDAIIFSGGSAAASNVPFPGYVFYGAFWRRELTDADAEMLHADPYCFLEYPEDDIFSTYVSLGTNITPLGVSGTGGVGAFAINADNATGPSGVAGTGSVGSFSVVTGQNITPTGVQGDGSAGSFAPTISSSVTLTGAAGTGSAGTISVPATNLTITNFATDRVWQRASGGTTKDIAIAGTYAGGAPTALNAVVSIVAGGTALSVACTNVSAAGGTWTATIPGVPQGAWYKATVTEPIGGATAAQTTQWGVGINLLLIGQSNMNFMWGHSAGGVAEQYTRRWNGNGWFSPDATLQAGEIGPAQGGQAVVTLLNNIRTAIGGTVPIAALEYAVDSTAIASWKVGGASWTTMISAANGLNKAGCSPEFEFVLWHQGENDSLVAATPGTYYAADLATVYSQCQSISGRNNTTLKFGVALMGALIGTSTNDANCNTVRGIHWNSSTTVTGMFFIGSTLDLIHLNGDEWHWVAAGLIRAGKRYANAVNYQLGLSTKNSEGPKISSASWPIGSNVITVAVQQRSGGTTLKDGLGSTSGTGLVGFVVTASGGQTVSSIALSNGSILLTMSGARGAGETVSFTYGQGKVAWGWTAGGSDTDDDLIYDDNSAALGDTLGFPLLPSLGSVTVGLGGGGGRRSLSLAIGIRL